MKRIAKKSKPPISMAAIRRYAKQIAERFQPDKIILFGSYAYGTPNEDSDVDLMVIMPAYNSLTQVGKIRDVLPAPFAMDMLICQPERWKLRVEDGESFILQILTKGKVLYEKIDSSVGQKSRGGLPHRKATQRGRKALT
jgi:uncharacterized protein